MKKRTLWGPLAAIAALYAIGIGLRMADDMRRYNRILEMSDEGPVANQFPSLMMQVLSEERATVKEWLALVMTFPGDLARYFRMESM
jgi:hypothetical protein